MEDAGVCISLEEQSYRWNKAVIKNGEASPGYNWWYDPRQPLGLHYYRLDSLYGEGYHAGDHVAPTSTNNFAYFSKAYCSLMRGRECATVLDFGAARCYFSEAMRNEGLKVFSVEGSAAGFDVCAERMGETSVLKHDFRIPLGSSFSDRSWPSSFDFVVCTEVAEHIEPPFAGTLVYSLTQASDIVWFTHAVPNAENHETVHHNNNQPGIFWDRLFAFFGFKAVTIPPEIVSMTHWRAGKLYYRESSIAFDRSALLFDPKLPEEPEGVLTLPEFEDWDEHQLRLRYRQEQTAK